MLKTIKESIKNSLTSKHFWAGFLESIAGYVYCLTAILFFDFVIAPMFKVDIGFKTFTFYMAFFLVLWIGGALFNIRASKTINKVFNIDKTP